MMKSEQTFYLVFALIRKQHCHCNQRTIQGFLIGRVAQVRKLDGGPFKPLFWA
jgi:hypothetical protein